MVATGRGATSPLLPEPIQSLGNWVTNFNLGTPARDIHRGFEDAVEPSGGYFDALKPNKTQPLFVTGHSLGGALAIIAAERIRRELKIEASAVYTFGAPRVGSAAFAGSYNAYGLGDRSYRLIHGLDIVPTLPPSRLGFRHVGRMIMCDRAAASPAPKRYRCAIATIRRFSTRSDGDSAGGLPILPPAGSCHRHERLARSCQKYVLTPTLTDHVPERYRRAFETAP